MLPTPRALELAPHVRMALTTLETSLDRSDFDPATATRTFTVQTNDYLVSTVMPALMRHLAERAPGVDVRIVPPDHRTQQLLDAGEIDFALGGYGELPERFGVAIVEDNEFACMMHAEHPLTRGRLELKRYAAAKHLLITLRGDPIGFVDEALAEQGLARRIALAVNHFSVVPAIVAESDLIVTMPLRMAEGYAKLYGLALRPSPVKTPTRYSHIRLVWQKRLGAHPAFEWFRALMLEVMENGRKWRRCAPSLPSAATAPVAARAPRRARATPRPRA
jgi:DNA-binding transcriptional LysR family regulator